MVAAKACLLAHASVSAAAPRGLTQRPGPEGCISEDGDALCTEGDRLFGAFDVTLSRDGRHAYVAAQTSAAVAVLRRAP